MAFSFRSVGKYVSSSSSSVIIPAPSGLTNGDLIVVLIGGAYNVTAVPSGWIAVKYQLSTYHYNVYYKFANNEGSSWTWTTLKSGKCEGYAYAFYGDIDTVYPIQGVKSVGAATSGTVINIPTLTTTSVNTQALAFSAAFSSSTAETSSFPPSSTPERR